MAKRTDYYKSLGEQVASLRKQAKITQKKMSELIGIDRSLISRFESLGEKLPTERIHEMLDVLGYELRIVEKKKSSPDIKERLRKAMHVLEETLGEMDRKLGTRASTEEDEQHTANYSDLNHGEC